MSGLPCTPTRCKEKADCARYQERQKSSKVIPFNFESNIKNGKCPYFVLKKGND